MRTIITLCCLFLFAGLFFSCGPDLFEVLDRSAYDPEISIPRVDCFKNINEIEISWDFDERADEYEVFWCNTPNGNYRSLGATENLSYVDKNLKSNVYYYYKLRKIKESKAFPLSMCVMGRANNIRHDMYEPNNTEEIVMADSVSDNPRLELVDEIVGNMYYYSDTEGNVLQDVDYYWMEIPARRVVALLITYPDGETNFTANQLYIAQGDSKTGVEIEGGAVTYNKLVNPGYEPAIIYFRIYPNGELINRDFGTGGNSGNYKINFCDMSNYVP